MDVKLSCLHTFGNICWGPDGLHTECKKCMHILRKEETVLKVIQFNFKINTYIHNIYIIIDYYI